MARQLTAQDLADYRADATGGDTFVEDLPPDPDAALGIYAAGGPGADVKLGYDLPAFQVIARAPDPRIAIARLEAIYAYLHGLHSVALVDGTWLVSCAGIQSAPVRIGRDQNGRHQFSLNFACDVRAVTTHRE